jgi:V/A-type H+-transporting ATPase subunit I
MFRPEKIYRTIAVIPKSRFKKMLIALQEKGICQVKEAEAGLNRIDPLEDEQRILSLYSRLSFVKEHLERHDKRKLEHPLKELFSGKKPSEPPKKTLPKEELFKKVEECLDTVEHSVRENAKEIENIETMHSTSEYLISNLHYLPHISTALLKDSPNIKKITGIVANSSIEEIKSRFGNNSVIVINSIDKRDSLLIMACLAKDYAEIEQSLHEAGFEELSVPYEDMHPHQIIKELKEKNTALASEKSRITKEMHELYHSYAPGLSYFSEQLEKLKERIDARTMMKNSDSFSVIECWVPAKNMHDFRACLKECTKSHCIIYEEREDSPSLLDNPEIIKPFEKITEMYSLPKYNNFDPTPIVALTFSLFFGFVVGDFFYGLLILLFGMLLKRGKGSYNKKTRRIANLIITLGISAGINGILFGSYFGNFIPDLLKSKGIAIPYLIDSMKQVLIVLMIALGIGVLHISTGLLVGFFENMRKGKPLDALQSQGVWLLFVSSAICFIFKQNLIGIILVLLSVLLQISLNFKASGFAPALLSVFSFAGFTGDVGSYARLMALSVSTSGIGLAFNLMTNMAVNVPFIGIIMAILIFIAGHIFNILMSCLGGFVHPLRLHFLEHFSKYYDGGGTKYVPYGNKTNTNNL